MERLYCPACGLRVEGADMDFDGAAGTGKVTKVSMSPPKLRPCGHKAVPVRLAIKDVPPSQLIVDLAVVRRSLIKSTDGRRVMVDREALHSVIEACTIWAEGDLDAPKGVELSAEPEYPDAVAPAAASA